jgi:HEAT repeat protein
MLAARVVQRSGSADAVIETCLAVLGDPTARPSKALREAVTASPPAVSVLPHDAETRAAQILSIICLNPNPPRMLETLQRYRDKDVSRTRSWVCFFLARTLGETDAPASVDALLDVLASDPTEASFGFQKPPNVFVYKAMAPFYRAAAADALGRLGDPRATDALLDVVADFDNAVSVRHAAARSLGKIAGKETLPRLREIADDYPEVATRRALLESCLEVERRNTD